MFSTPKRLIVSLLAALAIAGASAAAVDYSALVKAVHGTPGGEVLLTVGDIQLAQRAFLLLSGALFVLLVALAFVSAAALKATKVALRAGQAARESEEALHALIEAREVARRAAAEGAASLRDALTGLYHPQAFAEIGGQALRALARSKFAGCLFLVDLDELGTLNDRHGREAGDRAIAAAAKVLRDVFRDSDVLARVGGDEFAVLALECGLADIPSVLDRIAERVAAENGRDDSLKLSMSIGTALFEPPATADFEGLMQQAEHAMDEQKRLFLQRRTA